MAQSGPGVPGTVVENAHYWAVIQIARQDDESVVDASRGTFPGPLVQSGDAEAQQPVGG